MVRERPESFVVGRGCDCVPCDFPAVLAIAILPEGLHGAFFWSIFDSKNFFFYCGRITNGRG